MLARCVSRLTWSVAIALFVTAGCSRSLNADYWAVRMVDGKDVSRRLMSVGVKQGRIVGGDDGCNGWSYKSDASNMIESDFVACPQDQAEVASIASVMAARC